jgi:type II secretory pathway pseudopilin PulG
MGYDDDYDYDEDRDDGYGYDDQKPGGTNVMLIVVIILGVVGGLCAVIAVIAAIAIPNLLSARKNGNEAAAIGGLKTIANAQTLFREGDGDRNDVLDYGSLDQLSQVGYVDPVLGGGMKQGYEFQVEVNPKNPEFEWWAIARPAVPGTTGDRYFYADQTGIIYYSLQEPPQGPLDSSKPNPPGLNPLGM